jgi:hypothetical protein
VSLVNSDFIWEVSSVSFGFDRFDVGGAFQISLEESDYLFASVGFPASLVKKVFPFVCISVFDRLVVDLRKFPASDLEVRLSDFNQ